MNHKRIIAFLIAATIFLAWVSWVTPQDVRRLLRVTAEAAGGAGPFTFVDSDGFNWGGTSITKATNIVSVNDDDLQVIWIGFEGSTTTISIEDQDSNAFTEAGRTNNGTGFLAVFYLLDATATGSRTNIVTLGASRQYLQQVTTAVRPTSGTATYRAFVMNSSSGTSIDSGNLSPQAGSDSAVFGGLNCFGPFTLSATQIIGQDEDNFIDSDGNTGPTSTGVLTGWWDASAGGAGGATGTFADEAWLVGAISFD